MRVTFVLPDANLGGGTRVIAKFAEELKQRGHTVFISSSPRAVPGLRYKVESFLKGKGWPDVPLYPQSHLDGLDLEHQRRDRRRKLRDSDVPEADVVVGTWWETAEWMADLSPTRGAKAYFIQQYEANFGMPDDRVAETWRMPMQKIVCSGWLADLARDRFGDPTAQVCPNGIDLDQFHAPPRGKQAVPTIGFLYSTHPVKGLDISLAVAEATRRVLPDLRLRVFGTEEILPGHLLPDYADYTRTPPQDTIREIYAECDVWLCSSRSEGFHLPPHEAMACRTPVVATRVGGPVELIEEGVNGYLADVDDVETLARRVIQILTLSDPDWRRMSDAALETARRETWVHATDRFEKALELAVERFGSRRHDDTATRV